MYFSPLSRTEHVALLCELKTIILAICHATLIDSRSVSLKKKKKMKFS